ncbi:GDSL esterase/lipase [Tripterygium wilfordii]|uniref:GDSL esterase/lipase n=1 Tax=Tripterygium wilfordii TaxID=458696 RepID=A0A7J7C5L8_TRIWF|nr:GDSL esterase/lipase At5g03610-like [Tripterygium wilfordii]KAF5729421.1 GDSL esterase/lipase [Tripterygium wilfordii]
MEFIVLLLLIFSLFNNIYSTEATDVKKLFVFGDSLVDVGNYDSDPRTPWLEPYGMTFPGKPAGRFSDGRVLSDNIASFLGIEAPIAFKKIESAEKSELQNGMSFACGGSGVFDTPNINPDAPKMSKQIDNLQKLLEQEKLYTKDDLQSSVALVNTGVNDYMDSQFSKKTQSWSELSASLIDQLVIDIKRIQDLGVPKVAVATVMPVGCAPSFNTKLDHKSCNEVVNKDVDLHNKNLKEAVQKLNKVEIIDVHGAMMSVLKRTEESLKFNPLKQCCGGIIPGGDTCGTVGKNKEKMYQVCENPKLSVFWDFVHPSQNGWELIYSVLKSDLNVLFT